MESVIYRGSILITFYFIFATCVDYLTFSRELPHLYEALWPLQLAVAALFFLPDKNFLRGSWKIDLKKHLDILVVFGLLFSFRLWFIDCISVWLDEHIQGLAASHYLPILAGSSQHQPPGDMIFTNLGLWTSNISLWGLRIHSCLFSALAGATLFGLAKNLSRSILFALLCTAFFSVHHLVVRYGYEARPISLGLFMELVFFSVILFQLKHISKRPSILNGLFLSAVTFLYLGSLGLQPPFIIGTTAVYFSILSLFDRKYWVIPARIFLGLLLYLPLQIIIFKISPPRFTLTDGLNFALFFEKIKPESFYFLKEFYNPLGYICFALSVLYIASIFFWKKSFNATEGLLMFVATFFPLTLVPYFLSHIAWPLNDYYLISYLPLLFLLLASLWGTLFASVQTSSWTPTILSVCFFTVAGTSYQFVNRSTPLENEHQDLKSAYKVISENRKDDDLLLTFCLAEEFCPDFLIAKQFYLKNTPRNLYSRPSVQIFEDALKSGAHPQNIFFVYQQEWSSDKPDEKYLLKKSRNFLVYKIPVKSDLASTIIDFFTPYAERAFTEHKVHPEVIAYLVAAYNYLGDYRAKNQLLEIYKNKPKNVTRIDFLENILH